MKLWLKPTLAITKYVLMQIGGYWCCWCVRLHKFMHDDNEIKQLVDEKFILIFVDSK